MAIATIPHVFQIGQPHYMELCCPLVIWGSPLSTPPDYLIYMDEIYTFKVNMNNQSFDSRLVNQLSSNNLKRLQVEHLVFKHCLEAGFLSQSDKDKNTQAYQWYKSVLKANIQALSLLESVIVDSDMMGSLEEFEEELEAKAAAIIKDIAQRVMNTDILDAETSSKQEQESLTLPSI
ncbi:hypothetical protein CYQ91_20160 [Vibrio diabolicus]|uniref:Uncharacterized protein n=1 Tax=Vibrio diabolicus TaxID=50719 RepID=A0AAX1XIG6_9VIBR|nr:hypothetical protein [Vibrio diabolicus]RPB35153.1 hypothetical protein CYQ91_20160 [Vibrio diabolicus]